MKYFKRLSNICILLMLHVGCNVDNSNEGYRIQVERLSLALKQNPSSNPAIKYMDSLTSNFSNFNLRKPNYIVLHHTGEKEYQKVIEKMADPKSQVSSHYLILKNGTILNLVNDYLRSWHAGRGKWGTITDLNSCSLGIELDNDGVESFPIAQIDSLIYLLKRLVNTYNIPQTNILGHSDISYRKYDPSPKFPWKKLAMNGFGVWYDNDLNKEQQDFDTRIYLKMIGYDIKDVDSAIIAFKRHYIQENITSSLNDQEKAILRNVGTKFLK